MTTPHDPPATTETDRIDLLAKTALEEFETPPPADAGRLKLIDSYNAILREGGLRYPVAYHFVQELGKGRQGVVFLAVRQGARGCRTRHAVKLFDRSTLKPLLSQ